MAGDVPARPAGAGSNRTKDRRGFLRPHRGILLALVAAGCSPEQPSGAPAQSFPAESVLAGRAPEFPTPEFRLDTVARGLNVPWALAFAPGGRLFVTERVGRVRVIENGTLLPEPWAVLDVYSADGAESGLMGIALASDFATSRHVFVYGTFRKTTRERERRLLSRIGRRLVRLVSPVRASTLENRLIRLTDSAGRGVNPSIVARLPANQLHAGGALALGPDSMLYLTTGDAQHPPSSQSRAVLSGKVLRYRLDGGTPTVMARGLRNSQGLAWDSSGTLFAIEHGPTGLTWEGGRTGGDELNVIARAADYGWPLVTGRDSLRRFRQPVRVWSFALAPGGLAFHRGDLFVTGLRGVQLRRLVIKRTPPDGEGWVVIYDEPLLAGTVGRLRAIASAPDGSLYVGTSNRDGRGVPGPDDDLILRLRP